MGNVDVTPDDEPPTHPMCHVEREEKKATINPLHFHPWMLSGETSFKLNCVSYSIASAAQGQSTSQYMDSTPFLLVQTIRRPKSSGHCG